MKWEKLPFVVGEQYPVDYVVAVCSDRLRRGLVKQVPNKQRMLDNIAACGHATIIWSPTGTGWGASGFNHRCWRTVGGQPIVPANHLGG